MKVVKVLILKFFPQELKPEIPTGYLLLTDLTGFRGLHGSILKIWPELPGGRIAGSLIILI
jgi:hypothetical protein